MGDQKGRTDAPGANPHSSSRLRNHPCEGSQTFARMAIDSLTVGGDSFFPGILTKGHHLYGWRVALADSRAM